MHRGFTLVELMVGLALIGVLTAVVINSFAAPRKNARDAKRTDTIAQIQRAIALYANSCGGSYPNQLLATANNGCPTGTTLANFIPVIPADPLGGALQYTAFGTGTFCNDYHLGTPVGSYEGNLPVGDANYNPGSRTRCTGSSASFNGASAGVYDVRP